MSKKTKKKLCKEKWFYVVVPCLYHETHRVQGLSLEDVINKTKDLGPPIHSGQGTDRPEFIEYLGVTDNKFEWDGWEEEKDLE